MRDRKIYVAAAVLVGAIMVSSSALAGPFGQLGPYIQWGTNFESGDSPISSLDLPSVPTNSQTNPPLANGVTTLFARADYGVARSSVYATGDSFYTYLAAGWNDVITIDAAGLAGLAGIATMRVYYSWTLDIGTAGPTKASGNFNFGLGDTYYIGQENLGRDCTPSCGFSSNPAAVYRYDFSSGSAEILGPATPSFVDLVVPITFGAAAQLVVEADVVVNGGRYGQPSSSASADSSHSHRGH